MATYRKKVWITRKSLHQLQTLSPFTSFSPLAAKFDLELDAMDTTTAYLNGELEEDLYLLPPKGVTIPDGHCWKLKCSLYGLKQSASRVSSILVTRE